MKILIIEDEIEAAKMLSIFLSQRHEVFVAHSGRQAIQLALTHRPTLIISDWKLRDEIDGVDACKQIMEHHKAVIIFVSGSPAEQLREVAEALKPLHILKKPLDFENLSALIQQIDEDGGSLPR